MLHRSFLMHLFLGFLESHHGHRGLTEHYGKKTGNNVADSHADSAVDGRGIAHGIRNAKDKVFEGKTDDRFCHDVHKGSDQAGKEHAASQGGRSI